ncbi:MAG TPA: hypothetical protein VHT53_01040 [Candidatus Elarobacter sp.]|nr:hypothetical protein [Candidatus Elarobacter sp.]
MPEPLASFSAPLENEGFETALLAAGPDVPIETLMVAVGEPHGATWRLELAYFPGMEQELDDCAVMQCFAPVVDDVAPARFEELRRLTSALTGRMPFGTFIVLERERVAAFRHTLLLPPQREAAVTLVTQATWLISYLLSTFGAAVVQTAGGSTADDALDATPFAQVFR